MEYKILATEFTKKGYTFKQLFREGDFAIYEQRKENCAIPLFESVRITRHNGFSIGGVLIPPSEVYPASSAWGKDAFTSNSIEKAREYISKMRDHADDIATKNKEADIETGQLVRKVGIKLPNGEFSVKILGELNPTVKKHNLYPALKKFLKEGKIKETKRVSGSKGKAAIFYVKI